MRRNYIKVKLTADSKCKLCGDREETVNHIISEWSLLAQKECKTKYDWVRKVDPLGIEEEIEIWVYYQMLYVQTRIRPEEGGINFSGNLGYKSITQY